MNPVSAHRALSLTLDNRSFDVAVSIVKDHFELSEITLLSNNPEKVAAFGQSGIDVCRSSCWAPEADDSSAYIDTKVQEMGHIPHGRVGSERTSPVTFWFPDHPFANFYPCPVTIDGHTYPTVEHYYQAAKFANHSEIRRKVAGSADPTSAKALSRQYQSLVRRDWDTVKELVMYEAQVAKFAQHPDLRTKLIDSHGRDLVEDSPDDDYWGRTSVDKGFNRMGVLLMQLRESL